MEESNEITLWKFCFLPGMLQSFLLVWWSRQNVSQARSRPAGLSEENLQHKFQTAARYGAGDSIGGTFPSESVLGVEEQCSWRCCSCAYATTLVLGVTRLPCFLDFLYYRHYPMLPILLSVQGSSAVWNNCSQPRGCHAWADVSLCFIPLKYKGRSFS